MENSKNKFDLSMAYTVPIENLRVGSVFFEDTSPEVWEVTGNHFNPDVNADFTDVKLIGYLDGCEGDL